MKYSTLGSSQLKVSRVCLGTMTWGTQNTQHDADQQLAYALDRGINFVDTAEMYSIPPDKDSYGKTEIIIGDWLSRNSARRQDIILMSKIAGPNMPWIRNGDGITGASIIEAVDASLKRLQTDYMDVFQLHWPNRKNANFGNHAVNSLDFSHVNAQQEKDAMGDMLRALAQCIADGKIRYAGLSNESPWGVSQFLQMAQQENLPRVTSIQNEFHLLHTKDWPYLIEQCALEDFAYLPWSPLAAGMLSGKYLDGARPKGSRWTYVQRNGLFRDTPQANEAVRAYKAIADDNSMTLAQLALKWVDEVQGVTSTIIGATTMDQLAEDIDAFDTTFDDSVRKAIAKVRRQYPAPF